MDNKSDKLALDWDFENPPSPVLSNKSTRKYLLNRKKERKSRVKLTERFSEEHNSTRSFLSNSSNNENLLLTPNSDEHVVEEKLEVGSFITEAVDYKKSESSTTWSAYKSNDLEVYEVGFKTAGGRNVCSVLSKNKLQQSKKLFLDILHAGETSEVTSRSNKYSFLSKKKSRNDQKAEKENVMQNIAEDVNNFWDHGACKLLKPLECNGLDNTVEDNQDLLSTQETNQLFSNFTLFEDQEENFAGFTISEKEHSRKIHMELESVISQLVQNIEKDKPRAKSHVHFKKEEHFVGFHKGFVKETLKPHQSACKELPTVEPNPLQNIEMKTEDNQELDFLSSEHLNELFKIVENDEPDEIIIATDFKRFTVDMILESTNYFNKFVGTISNCKKTEEPKIKYPAVGFTSATGKKCKISNSALAQIQKTFKDFDFGPITNQSIESFSVAADKNVPTKSSNLKNKGHNFLRRTSLGNSSENTQLRTTVINKKSNSSISNYQENLPSTSGVGFMTATGNKYQISNAALAKVQQTFKDFELDGSSTEHFPVIFSATTSTNLPQKTVANSSNCDKSALQGNQSFGSGAGFTTAAGNKFCVSDSTLARVQQTFKDFDFQPFSNEAVGLNKNRSMLGSEVSCHNYTGSTISTTTTGSTTVKDVYNVPNSAVNTVQEGRSIGFSTATGNKFRFSDSVLTRVQETFKDIDFASMMKSDDESSCGSFSKAKKKCAARDRPSLPQSVRADSLDHSSVFSDSSTLQADVSLLLNKNNRSHTTKRLGISSRKQISISKDKIERAMKIFNDEKLPVMSPLKTNVSGVYNSTPQKNTSFVPIDSDITPIKTVNRTEVENCSRKDIFSDGRFKMHGCTKGTLDSWNAALGNERRMLEMRIQIIAEKQKGLALQKHLLEASSQDRHIRRNGILYNKKHASNRVSLQHFVKIDSSTKGSNILPQNAFNVHFDYTDQNLSSVATLDGACVIPNIHNEIGLSEIEIAFKVMPGVDAKLLPNGWIRNHFKWIVWKLASYESFSLNMKTCLTLENVIQQLKYRYDREIDKAERSTLRKIFELDDAPQKRMVLCVSQIFNLKNGQREIELTDGWYSIRTSIDDVLSQQITKLKIQVGTKLMICGAELLNCEGCHPLECSDTVRLKINANSTRRTRWYVKLGYQRSVEPFPIKLCTTLATGGLIGCVKILIARVYPVKYLERQNKLTIWRNRKAEELYAQEWDNKIRQDMCKIRDSVTRSYQKQLQQKKMNKNISVNNNEISKINCPETLFELYQNSKDPERFQELLSCAQKSSIIEYQQRLSFLQQQELSRKINDSIGGLQMNKRDVTSVLQLRIIDILDENRKDYIFQIWRPSDTHFEMIKESLVFYVYNVVPKNNGNFATVNRTKFQVEQKEFPEATKYKRKLLRISDIKSNLSQPSLHEFDTVGIVVALKLDSFMQNLWLADPSGRLLFVKIFEAPKNCLLLDNLTIGRPVAVSNLLYSRSQTNFGEAIANHLTIISSYPQLKHLKDGINQLNNELPKNLQEFLNECEGRISYYIDKLNILKDQRKSTSIVQSNSLISSDIFDESSDVLFSMIDIDKFT